MESSYGNPSSYVHTLIHFRREKEANRIACTSDMTRFRLGQSDNMRYAYEKRNQQRKKKKKEKMHVRAFVAFSSSKELRSNGV